MDDRCPACAAHLSQPRSLPRAGERSWLPLRQQLACPHCGERVELNLHPLEQRMRALDAALIAGAGLAVLGGASMTLFWLALGASGMLELGLALWRHRRLAAHPRYRRPADGTR